MAVSAQEENYPNPISMDKRMQLIQANTRQGRMTAAKAIQHIDDFTKWECHSDSEEMRKAGFLKFMIRWLNWKMKD